MAAIDLAVRFGPGTFTLGSTPTDFSCNVQKMGVNPEKDEGDPLKLLCGDTLPGSITYTFTLAGTILQDIGTADGLAQFCWENMGQPVPFTYTPSTASETAISGTVIVDPVSLGTADGEVGDVLTSDIEFAIVGTPTVAWPAAA